MYEQFSPTPTAWIRYKGAWDMQDLYESMVEWFRQRKYKFHEKIYKHKHPSPFGVERQYIWTADKKENEYVMSNYDVYMHTYDAYDVDVVMKDGTKKTFTKGRIWIELKITVLFDWEKRFQKAPFFNYLREFYHKYVINLRIAQGYGPKFRTEFHYLHNLVLERLKAETAAFEHAHLAGVHRRL